MFIPKIKSVLIIKENKNENKIAYFEIKNEN